MPETSFLTISPKLAEIKEKLFQFVQNECIPAEQVFYNQLAPDRWNTVPPVIEELKIKAKKLGLWNLFLPKNYPNSPGLSNLEYALLCEVLGRSPLAPEATNSSAPDTGNMELLERYASPQQKSKWLTRLLDGTIRSAFAMTEPRKAFIYIDVPSSDATNISTTIHQEGTEWVVNGMKTYISGAGDPRCELLLLLGVTDAKAAKHQRHSVIIIPKSTPGVTIVR
jgi:acyl-CoA dehydrogenase